MSFLYIHKDGKQGRSDIGAWFAIKQALVEEAEKVVSESEVCSYRYSRELEGFSSKATLTVNGETVGHIYK